MGVVLFGLQTPQLILLVVLDGGVA